MVLTNLLVFTSREVNRASPEIKRSRVARSLFRRRFWKRNEPKKSKTAAARARRKTNEFTRGDKTTGDPTNLLASFL